MGLLSVSRTELRDACQKRLVAIHTPPPPSEARARSTEEAISEMTRWLERTDDELASDIADLAKPECLWSHGWVKAHAVVPFKALASSKPYPNDLFEKSKSLFSQRGFTHAYLSDGGMCVQHHHGFLNSAPSKVREVLDAMLEKYKVEIGYADKKRKAKKIARIAHEYLTSDQILKDIQEHGFCEKDYGNPDGPSISVAIPGTRTDCRDTLGLASGMIHVDPGYVIARDNNLVFKCYPYEDDSD